MNGLSRLRVAEKPREAVASDTSTLMQGYARYFKRIGTEREREVWR
jgi:hypothetical protein